MGVFDFIKKAAKSAYSGIKRAGGKALRSAKRAGGKALDLGRKIAGAVSKPLDVVNEGVKKMLDKVYDVPVLGDIARKGIQAARLNPKLGAVIRALEGTSAGIDALEAFGKGDDKEAKRQMLKAAKSQGGRVGRRIMKIARKI